MTLRFVVLVIVACLASTAGAGEAKGSFELDGASQEFTHAAAFRIPDRADPTQEKTCIFLTPSAMDADAVLTARDTYTAAINMPATDGDYLTFFVDDVGIVSVNAHIGGVQYIDSSGKIMGMQGRLKAECATNEATRVACKVDTPEAVETRDGTRWNLAAVFDVAVLKRPPGKPVDAGGGEPGKALLALEAALKGDDLDQIVGHLSERRASFAVYDWQTPEENLQSVKEDLANQIPAQLEVTGGEYIDDNEVELKVHGKWEGMDDIVVYAISMVREGERWVCDGGRMIGFIE